MAWHKFQRKMFTEKLVVAEQNLTRLSLPEQRFVNDMRNLIKAQVDAEELGIRSLADWEPSVRQINYLTSIHEKL